MGTSQHLTCVIGNELLGMYKGAYDVSTGKICCLFRRSPMHPSLPPRPPRPAFLPQSEAPKIQLPTYHVPGPPSYFTNSSGYQPPGQIYSTLHHRQNQASASNSCHSSNSELVNPYAPEISYSLLPLPSVHGNGSSRTHNYLHGSQTNGSFASSPFEASLASFSRGLGLPPQANGAGTFGQAGCTQAGCQFRGSKKEVQIHMMDRHLVYPPGWKDMKRKRDDGDDYVDEEAEARLKG